MVNPLDDDELVPMDVSGAVIDQQDDEDELVEMDVVEDPKPRSNESWESYVKRVGKDVALQFIKGTTSGALGSYGNIAELLGLKQPDGPPERLKAKHGREFDILEKMNQGQAPSFTELLEITDDDQFPDIWKLPTSRGIEEIIEPYIGEPETMAGRYAKRGGSIYGGGLALGATAPLPAGAAAIAGQTTEEVGGGPGAQLISEIAALVLTQGRGGGPKSGNRAVQQRMDALKELGYTDEEITLAVNASKENMSRSRLAKRTEKVERAFESVQERGEHLVDNILAEAFPGIEEGAQSVHSAASDIYGDAVRAAESVSVKNSKPFVDKAEEILAKFSESIEALPESQQSSLIKSIKEGLQKLKGKTTTDPIMGTITEAPKADQLIELYKRFNQLGKWVGRDMKDRYLSQLKTSIKETIGEQNKGLLDKFEEANKAVRRAYQAEEVSELIQKARNADGALDYRRLKKMVDNPKNRKLLEDTLGDKQASNLYQIAKTGKEVGSFSEKFGTLNTNWLQTGMFLGKASAVAYGLWSGDMRYVYGALVARVGHSVTTRLATQSLTNPRLQNITIRGLNALKTGSQKEFNRSMSQLIKYLEDEGIDLEDDELVEMSP